MNQKIFGKDKQGIYSDRYCGVFFKRNKVQA